MGRTALGLLALGAASALFGALVLGPMLGDRVAPRRLTAARANPESREVDLTPASHEPAPAPDRTEDTRPVPHPKDRGHVETVEVDVHDADTEKDSAEPTRKRSEEPDERTTRRDTADRPEDDRQQGTEGSAPKETPAPRETQDRHTTPAPAHVSSDTGSEVSASVHPARRSGRRAADEPREDPPVKKAHPAASPEPGMSASSEGKVYRVRVGRFQNREEAVKLRDEVAASGTQASIVRVGTEYRVQVGAYGRKSNAEKIAGQLRSHNYTPDISEGERPATAQE